MREPKTHCQDRDHRFLSEHHGEHETKTWLVVALTATMMVVEIVVGYWTGSMALLADGFHMATHAGALLIAALTYRIARRWAGDPRFTFGTGKLSDLGGFSSALLLGAVAVYVAISSVAAAAGSGSDPVHRSARGRRDRAGRQSRERGAAPSR